MLISGDLNRVLDLFFSAKSVDYKRVCEPTPSIIPFLKRADLQGFRKAEVLAAYFLIQEEKLNRILKKEQVMHTSSHVYC